MFNKKKTWEVICNKKKIETTYLIVSVDTLGIVTTRFLLASNDDGSSSIVISLALMVSLTT